MAKEEISNISSGSVYHIINQIQLDKTDEDTSRVPFTNVGLHNGAPVESWQWKSYLILRFAGHMITYIRWW